MRKKICCLLNVTKSSMIVQTGTDDPEQPAVSAYLLTYFLIPCSRFRLDKLAGSQVVKKYPAIYVTRRFITAFTSARQGISLGTRPLLIVCNKLLFYGEELLASRPNTKLEDHPFSAVRDCLFNLFAATLHIGGRSSIPNLRTRHAVVTGTHKHGLR